MIHELSTPKEQCPEFWIFSFLSIFCVKKPYRSVNAYTITTALRIELGQGKSGQSGSRLSTLKELKKCRRFGKLKDVVGLTFQRPGTPMMVVAVR
jgi:hypothetical protein